MPKLLAAVLLALPLTWPDAAQAPVAEPKANGQPVPVPVPVSQQNKPAQPGYRPRTTEPVSVPKQAAYRVDKTDTDASRCDMARDIKSDKLAHSNGMPIDANDLQTAENDIRLFCR